MDDEIRRIFAEFGKKGQEIYRKNTTPAQRKRAAKKAAKARWAKRKRKSK